MGSWQSPKSKLNNKGFSDCSLPTQWRKCVANASNPCVYGANGCQRARAVIHLRGCEAAALLHLLTEAKICQCRSRGNSAEVSAEDVAFVGKRIANVDEAIGRCNTAWCSDKYARYCLAARIALGKINEFFYIRLCARGTSVSVSRWLASSCFCSKNLFDLE